MARPGRTLDALFYGLLAVTAVAVGGVALTGGIGGAKNAALGALIVTALNDGLILLNVNPYVQEAVNGFVLVIAVAALAAIELVQRSLKILPTNPHAWNNLGNLMMSPLRFNVPSRCSSSDCACAMCVM